MSKKSQVLSNLLWRFAERIGANIVKLVVELVLARLLLPEDYGAIALVTVFITIMQVFVDSGMGNALIQKKDADDLDFSTVFYFNMFMCSVLYIIMFVIAPFIASFYDMPELTSVIRVLSLVLIVSGLKNVQQAYVSRNMLFKRFFFATLSGTIGAAILGIVMAYLGFGVWALVAQMLFNTTIDTIILWITVKWRPKKMFSIQRVKVLFSFGWKLLVSSLIDTVYTDIRQLIIGKKYSKSDLAQNNQGNKFPQFIVVNINSSIDSVLFPTMSKAQNNKEIVKNMTRRAIRTSTYIMMPLMTGLAVCAEPLVRLVLFFLRLACFTYAFYPIHTANLNAIKALGRSDLFLILEIIKKSLGITVVISTMFISVEAMAIGSAGVSLLSQIINSWPNRKLLGYSYENQLMDMLPQILLSIFMGAIVYCVQLIGLGSLITILIQIPVGIFVYIALSKLFHIDSFDYLVATVKGLLGRKKKKEVSE